MPDSLSSPGISCISGSDLRHLRRSTISAPSCLYRSLFDWATCFLIADLARRLFSERAAQAAFLLAALCPFLANYAASALTETLEIFFTALALDLALRGLGMVYLSDEHPASGSRLVWLGCGLSIGAAILLRPDGGILLAAIGGYLLWLLLRGLRQAGRTATNRLTAPRISAGWSAGRARRCQLRWFPGRCEICIPCTASSPSPHAMPPTPTTSVMNGFNRWVKTWIADYVSVQEIYWDVPGDEIDASKLPRRAFDSRQQQQQTTRSFRRLQPRP